MCFDNDDDYDEENSRKTGLTVTVAFCLIFLSFDNSCAGYGSDDDDNNKIFFFFFFAADLLVLKLVNIPCWICGASIDLRFAAVVCVSSNR